jgi:hypothetical protein
LGSSADLFPARKPKTARIGSVVVLAFQLVVASAAVLATVLVLLGPSSAPAPAHAGATTQQSPTSNNIEVAHHR